MPQGILIAAVITSLVTLGVVGLVIWKMTVSEERRWMGLALVLTLPLQPAAFSFVRVPLHEVLISVLGRGGLMDWIPILYAPLIEEPAKWLVLLLFARRLTLANAFPAALAVGLGFALGEIWFLAERVGRNPVLAQFPFWMFGGFLGERFLVGFLHGLMIMFAAWGLARGRGFWLGGLIGMAIHLAANAPILLIGLRAFGIPGEVWQGLVSVWLVVLVIWTGMVGLARHRRYGGRAPFSDSHCPECGQTYPRPLFAVNLGPRRYERCPCRKWHMVKA